MIKLLKTSAGVSRSIPNLIKWALLLSLLSFFTGSLVALFLWLLEKVNLIRFEHPWLLYLLPLAGILIYCLYRFFGKNSEGGNNLLLEEIHEPQQGVPARMGVLVLGTTLLTHLFGGSAGREGTAVQMGGSLAAFLGRRMKLKPSELRIILICGIAAGFGAVFGTPVTGAIFALEVLAIGRVESRLIIPCIIASLLADITCSAYGIHHTAYHIALPEPIGVNFRSNHFDLLLLVKVLIAGICFGLASQVFSRLSHGIRNRSQRLIPAKWLIPVTGGIIIILLTFIAGTDDYLGLGLSSPDPGAVTIVSSFSAGGARYFSWLWKILFTAVTLGMGFKGGEVTPLFFIGASLGNVLAIVCGAPVDLIAGLGFIAVFASATKTPVACTLMGVELFGGHYILYYAVACFTANYFSGNSGIYNSQRAAITGNAASGDYL